MIDAFNPSLEMKWVFKHQDLQIFGPTLNKCEYFFQPHEVVGRGSETQLQVGKKNVMLYIW